MLPKKAPDLENSPGDMFQKSKKQKTPTFYKHSQSLSVYVCFHVPDFHKYSCKNIKTN